MPSNELALLERQKRRKGNAVLKIEDGAAYVDVSTPRHHDAVAIIDAADIALVCDPKRRWNAVLAKRLRLYVVRNQGGRLVYLHRYILGLTPRTVMVDHRNGDALDNRRDNLRIATPMQNAQHSRPERNKGSQYKGVYWDKERSSWAASCNYKFLGRFANEVEAAQAHDRAAVAAFGDFAWVNFPEEAVP